MNNTVNFKIQKEHSGKSVNAYLRHNVKLSARAVKKLKNKKLGILVNGVHARVVDIIHENDVLSLDFEEESRNQYEVSENLVDIIYEDENLIVVDKPPFMAMYPMGKHVNGTLMQSVKLPKGGFKPIYRLDMNTSGLVVLAKNSYIMAGLSIDKTYTAICEGVTDNFGEIDSPIQLREDSIIIRETGMGKHAFTSYEKMASDDKHSLLKIKIKTGRTHQIRVHMQSIGHPLCGDDLYGGKTDFINRHALHCGKIVIKSNLWDSEKVIKLLPPQDMYTVFSNLFIKGE